MKNAIILFVLLVLYSLPVQALYGISAGSSSNTVSTINLDDPHEHRRHGDRLHRRFYTPSYQRGKIYTPDCYNCYMKKNLKYCVNLRGNAISGQIVTSDGEYVAYENYQNGYQSGITSTYTRDGTLIQRTAYKKGLKDGEETTYYINGNTRVIAHYNDGALDGRLEEYDINGALIGKMTYRKGWFKNGYCKNERGNHTMHERLNASEYNEIIPCGEVFDDIN